MKTLKSLLQQKSLYLPSFKPHEQVTHVMNRGEIIKLKVPCDNREITCPICGGDQGFKLINPEVIWSCIADDCIDINAQRIHKSESSFSSRDQRIVPTLKSCGISEEFENARFSDIHQPAEILQKLQEYSKSFQGFLLLSGTSGVGKTYASCALMQKFWKQVKTLDFSMSVISTCSG